jgi:GTP-binding protein
MLILSTVTSMDILRLPTALRRSLLSQPAFILSLRRLTTAAAHDGALETPLHTPAREEEPSPLLTLSSATLNSYTISHVPDYSQLKAASAFFTRQPPTLLFSAPNFRHLPQSHFPEVAFLGRSNVGKSSLLNAIFGRSNDKVAHVSKHPGRTKMMNGFGIGGEGGTSGGPGTKGKKKDGETMNQEAWKRFGRGGIIVVDMPGYGGGSRQEWGVEAMKFLENRKQLRRTFVLVDAEHGLKSSDISLLVHLRKQGIAHQIVLSKVDKLLYPHAKPPGPESLHNRLLKLRDVCGSIRQTLNEAADGGRDAMEDILCCSAEKSLDDRVRNTKIGVNEIRWSAMSACGIEATV